MRELASSGGERGEQRQGDEGNLFWGLTIADWARGGGSAWSSWRQRPWRVGELVPAEMGDLDTSSAFSHAGTTPLAAAGSGLAPVAGRR